MAKVTGPAHSLSASGTLADLITFDKRGIAHSPNSPSNQQTAERGNARQIFLSMSRALQRCQSSVRTAIQAAAHPATDWRAWMIRRAIGEGRSAWVSNGLTWATMTDPQRATWDEAATETGFTTTAIAYATDDPISAGLAMFELAAALYAAGLVTAPGEPGTANADEWAEAITGTAPPPPSYLSLWSLTDTPEHPYIIDANSYELGVLFKSDIMGNVVGLRFYKSPGNTGTHVGHLWTQGGTMLAEVTFTGETESGWQTAMFSTPVSIQADTYYVISYLCPNGFYSINYYYWPPAHDNAPLHAPTSEGGLSNGLFNDTPGSFPTSSFQASNYWVDVLFQE